MLILGVEHAPSSNNAQKAASIETFFMGGFLSLIVHLPSQF
jgi:hypothetical protein